jgi:hypothetical protein
MAGTFRQSHEASIVNTTQMLSHCTECGTVRTVTAIDSEGLILIRLDSQKTVVGVCTRCHTPWVLGGSERNEIAHEMAVLLQATEADTVS